MGHWAAAYKTTPKESSKKAQEWWWFAGGCFCFKKGRGVGLEKKDGSELNDGKLTNYTICDKMFVR